MFTRAKTEKTLKSELPEVIVPKEHSYKQLKHFVAGGIAGAISRTSVSPFERLKILLQIQVSDVKFKGIIPSLITIGKEEGILGYFKGNGTNVIRIIPYSAVQFTAYEEYKKLLNIPEHSSGQKPGRRLLAGAMAGVTSITATYPLDLVRTRLSAQGEGPNKKYRGIVHAFQTILKEEGGFMSGCLYRGLVPTTMGIAPYVGLNFTVYESLKVTYPLDVVRRRMQMKGIKKNEFAYNSTVHAFKSIVKKEGVRGLYKGILPNLIKVLT
ncbi:hypothetical protein QZH41_019982, partial [Actinostola sp. cb2023]